MENVSLQEVFDSYFECRKGKRNTHNASEFEENLETNLISLYRDLNDGTYSPGRSICFVVTHPNLREIWAADFRDRIVQTLFYQRYQKTFHSRFIFDSFACIPEKGTLRAAKRLDKHIRSYTENYQIERWFLKADIANFFVAIDKDILFSLVAKRVEPGFWTDLLRTLLYNDPRDNFIYRGDPRLLKCVPKRKSLAQAANNVGLPVGNLTSQFFANIYLNELDQFCKRELKVKHYLRYVDDFIILGESPFYLNGMHHEIGTFLREKLHLSLHSNKKQINKTEVGINFVGFVVKHHRMFLRRGTIRSCNRKLEEVFQREDWEMLQSINSYFGMMRHTNSYKLRKKIVNRLSWMGIECDGEMTKVLL